MIESVFQLLPNFHYGYQNTSLLVLLCVVGLSCDALGRLEFACTSLPQNGVLNLPKRSLASGVIFFFW